MSWERNEIINEMDNEELAKFKEQFKHYIKKQPQKELTEREKWLLSMPEDEAIKILLAEQNEFAEKGLSI